MKRMDWAKAALAKSPLLVMLFAVSAAMAQNDIPHGTAWTPNGPVHAMVQTPEAIYIGGGFNYLGRAVGHAAPFDAVTGQVSGSFPWVEAYIVFASAPDGSGGWYIGGGISKVAGVARNGIAHILSNGALDIAWNPGADGEVYALAVSDSILYAGGEFTYIGGQPRNHIAALDAATGAIKAWDPNADNTVCALGVSGSMVYAGGDFSHIGGQSRKIIAALDAATGGATPWDPSTTDSLACVNTLAIVDSKVYAGGNFSNIGGQPRNGLAAIEISTGNATSWNPNAGQVTALAVLGGTVYTGHQGLAAYDAATGAQTAWNPNPSIADGYVEIGALAASDSTIIVGGRFTSIGGRSRANIAALDPTTGAATPWDPGADSEVETLAVSGSSIFAGGLFTTVNGQMRRAGVAALDPATGAPTPWNPDTEMAISALAVSGSKVYAAGGSTTLVGGGPYVIKIDAATGAVTDLGLGASLSASWSDRIDYLAASSTTVYAGGRFDEFGEHARNNLAAFDIETGAVTDWNPNPSGGNPETAINALVYAGGEIYAGGNFTSIGGQARNYAAALNPQTGAADAWNPNANGPSPGYGAVTAIAFSNQGIFLGGSFTTIGGQPRSHLALVSPSSGSPYAWYSDVDGSVYSLVVSGSTLYAGGAFTVLGGQIRNCAGAVDLGTGAATGWNPNINYSVETLAVSGAMVYAGGSFTMAGGQQHCYLAQFGERPAAARRWEDYR